MSIQTEQFMQRAIVLARKGLGRTAPNPPVGAVLVRDGKIIGEGFHPAAGQPHAEVFALREAGELALGADLYVTLEPCCHHGRTGPCTEALINAGVSRVYIGTQDPNPLVAGKGTESLRQAGVDVICEVLTMESQRLIAPFTKSISKGLPYVIFKAAMTLDGKTATSAGDSKWISCAASRELVHQLRNQVDGIVVGSRTVKADDPRLTTRLADGDGRDPVRIVFDGSLKTSPQATLYTQPSEAKTVLVTASDHAEAVLQPYRVVGADIIQVSRNDDGLDLSAAMIELVKMNLHSILLEGGSVLGGAMLRADLVDQVMVFVAPKMIGGKGRDLLAGDGVTSISDAWSLINLRARQIDTDILIEGEVQHVHRPD